MGRNSIKTVFLMAALSGLFFLIGYLLGGNTGLWIALVVSIGINFYAYFNSHKLALKAHKAQPLDKEKYPQIYKIVEELAFTYKIPMPTLWLLPTDMANAFATGRSPKHAHVAVTQGIVKILDERELRGVLAHELGHVKNRDILVSTIAVTFASAIGMLAMMLRFSALTGRGGRGGGIGVFLIALTMPFVAMLIHMGISRSREYMADASGADVSEDPLALASALKKLEASVTKANLTPKKSSEASTASLFIVYPFKAKSISRFFSTHPPMEERIARLEEMAKRL